MPETGPSHIPQEPGENPGFESMLRSSGIDRVDDSILAEHMAHASDESENGVVEHRRLALEHAAKIGDPDGYNHREAALDHAEAAQDAREEADERADITRIVYEETKDL